MENKMPGLDELGTNQMGTTIPEVNSTVRYVPVNGNGSKIYPYAGFWRRAIAFIFDSCVVYGVCLLVALVLWGIEKKANLEFGFNIFSLVVGAVYAIFMGFAIWYCILAECSPKQATLGKRILGIKVVNKEGMRISVGQAFGRAFGKVLSSFILYFGFFMAGFTKRRQALHDVLADTYVVVKQYKKEEGLSEVNFSNGYLVVSIFASLASFVLPMIMELVGLVFLVALFDPFMVGNAMDNLKTWKESAKTSEVIVPEDTENFKYEKKKDGYYATYIGDENPAKSYKLFLPLKEEVEEACCMGSKDTCEEIEVDLCK